MKRSKKIFLALCFSFMLASPAYGSYRGDAHGSNVEISAKTAETIQTSKVYKEIHSGNKADTAGASQTQDPYTYAFTAPCSGISTRCNLTKCTDPNGHEGVLLQILYALRDSGVKGAGTDIEWNDTDSLKGWSRGGSDCISSGRRAEWLASGGIEELTITVSQEDFQSLPLAPAQLNLPNVQGHTLKNAHTNIWAKAETQNLTTEINGSPVEVEATPVAYVFSYGDGQKLETTNPGYGLHEDDGWDVETPTSHVYKETGNYPVSVTTIYTGRYSVDGGPWLPVNGTAQAGSEEKTVRVWRVRAGNVADSCVENPKGWGCPGT